MTDLAAITKLVDAYIAKRTERLKVSQQEARLIKEEHELKNQLLLIRAESGARSLGGSLGTLNYQRKNKPVVTDWEKFYAYVREHNAFELLQKRLGEQAVQERWEDEIAVPGVGTFPVDDFTISGKTE